MVPAGIVLIACRSEPPAVQVACDTGTPHPTTADLCECTCEPGFEATLVSASGSDIVLTGPDSFHVRFEPEVNYAGDQVGIALDAALVVDGRNVVDCCVLYMTAGAGCSGGVVTGQFQVEGDFCALHGRPGAIALDVAPLCCTGGVALEATGTVLLEPSLLDQYCATSP